MTEQKLESGDAAQAVATITPIKAPVGAVERIMPLAPRTMDEAYRCAEAFVLAGMAPESYVIKRNPVGKEVKPWEDGQVDMKATTARVMIGILKGMEVGYGPATALQVIMIINNKPCVYGDGASALVNASGVLEWQRKVVKGEKWGPGYKVSITMKRRDQTEPLERSFSYEDAQRAQLVTKKGPWVTYPERQCYWRAWSWAARDAASDALMGLSVAEEVGDYAAQAPAITDTTDLDDQPREEHAA